MASFLMSLSGYCLCGSPCGSSRKGYKEEVGIFKVSFVSNICFKIKYYHFILNSIEPRKKMPLSMPILCETLWDISGMFEIPLGTIYSIM